MDLSIIPECYIDTNLIETLVPPIKQYNHQKGCGTVTKVMKEKFADRFALGIIDKDKKEVDYLKEFRPLCNTGSLILHKHTTRHHYIIQINPAMERFILHNARQAELALEAFDLYTDLEQLKKAAKTVTSKNDLRFKKLFDSIREKGTPDFDKLIAWLIYLKTNTYKSDEDEIIKL